MTPATENNNNKNEKKNVSLGFSIIMEMFTLNYWLLIHNQKKNQICEIELLMIQYT